MCKVLSASQQRQRDCKEVYGTAAGNQLKTIYCFLLSKHKWNLFSASLCNAEEIAAFSNSSFVCIVKSRDLKPLSLGCWCFKSEWKCSFVLFKLWLLWWRSRWRKEIKHVWVYDPHSLRFHTWIFLWQFFPGLASVFLISTFVLLRICMWRRADENRYRF